MIAYCKLIFPIHTILQFKKKKKKFFKPAKSVSTVTEETEEYLE